MKYIYFFIGNGRDGTNSLASIAEDIKLLNEAKFKVSHEYCVKEIYNNFNYFYDDKKELKLRTSKILNKFVPGNIYVGNGYTLILKELKKKFGSRLKILYVKRQFKDWLVSFKRNVKFYPQKHGNYSKKIDAEIFRMAAWHFNEISIQEWNKLSLNKKLRWYYKKNFDLIKISKIKKKKLIVIKTESLNNINTLKKITEFINKSFISPRNSNHVNISKIDYAKLEDFEKKIVGSFYSRFDYLKAAKNPIYGADFFNSKVFVGFKNRNTFIHSQVNLKQLNYIKKKYLKYLKLIKEYEKD